MRPTIFRRKWRTCCYQSPRKASQTAAMAKTAGTTIWALKVMNGGAALLTGEATGGGGRVLDADGHLHAVVAEALAADE